MQRLIWVVGIAAGLALAIPSGETAHAQASAIASTPWTARTDHGECSSEPTIIDRAAVQAHAVAGDSDISRAGSSDAAAPAPADSTNSPDDVHAAALVDAHAAPSSTDGNRYGPKVHCDHVEHRAATQQENSSPITSLSRGKSGDHVAPDALNHAPNRVPRVHHVRVNLGMEQALPQTGVSAGGGAEIHLFLLGLFSLAAGVVITRYSRHSSAPTPHTPPILAAEQLGTVGGQRADRPASISVWEAGDRLQRFVPHRAPAPSGVSRMDLVLSTWSDRVIGHAQAWTRHSSAERCERVPWSHGHSCPATRSVIALLGRFPSHSPPSARRRGKWEGQRLWWRVGSSLVPT